MAEGEGSVMFFGAILVFLGGSAIYNAIFDEFSWIGVVIGPPVTLIGVLMIILPNLKPPQGFDL